MKNIGIFFDDTYYGWGPGKLALNTIKGFDRLNINYKLNDYYEYNLCISGTKLNTNFYNSKIKNSIIGPGSIDFPWNHGKIFTDYPKILVPSDWVKNLWVSQGAPEDKINSWFGGIDVDLFEPKKNIKYDCLILFKNRSQNDLDIIKNILDEKKLSYFVLSNGLYDEEIFLKITNSCKFCIVLHNTETQGFAIMEVMSMDLPMLVFDFNIWESQYDNATSVPYFEEKCGRIVGQKDFNLETINSNIDLFLNDIDYFSPRNVILEKYTLEHSIKLLDKYFKEI